MSDERALTTILVRTSNGTTELPLSDTDINKLHDGAGNDKATVAVVDWVSFAYDNADGATPALVSISITPYTLTAPIWRALASIPAGEAATIDKEFMFGLPLWKGTSYDSGSDDLYIKHHAMAGVAQGAGTPYSCGSVAVLVNGAPWVGSATGNDCLVVGYHLEPAAQRRA